MLATHRIELRMSERRERLSTLLEADEMTDAERAELDQITAGLRDDEKELRAAKMLEAADEATEKAETAAAGDDSAEDRELRALMDTCHITNFFLEAAGRARLAGAELEVRQELGAKPGEFPMALLEKRDATPAPSSGTGVNVDMIQPAVFARSIAPRLGIAMPAVESGTYSTMVITTSVTAEAKNPGSAGPATAGALTPKTTGPFRVTGTLTTRLEDVAKVGIGTFESRLRQNLTMVLSATVDEYMLTGSGSDPIPHGLFPQLTDPTDPTTVADFDDFLDAAVDGIDGGPWAPEMSSVVLVVNADTLKLAEKSFALDGDNTKGVASKSMSAAKYLRENAGGIFAHSRMPATASDIAGAIRYRASTMGLDGVDAVRTAVCPHWGMVGITDPYSDAPSGMTHFTVATLIGDTIIEYGDAYSRVDFKLA